MCIRDRTFTRLAYDQSAVVALIKPKDMGDDNSNDGFFSSLAELYAEYPFAMLILTILVIAGMAGVGIAVNNQNKNRVIFSNEEDDPDSLIEAELL